MMRGCPPVAVGAGRTDSRRLFPGQPAGSGCDITGRRKTLGPGFLYGKPGERRSAAAVPALPPSLRCGQSRRAAGLGLFPSYSLLLLFLSKSIKCSGGIWGWKAAVPGDEVSPGGGNSQCCTPEDALAVLLSAGWARPGGGQPGKEQSVTRPGCGRLHKALPLPPACVCSAASV